MTPTGISAASLEFAAAIEAIDYSKLRVLPEYIDPNGHMNVGYYGLLFDKASDLPCAQLNIGYDMISRGLSVFTLESHTTYQREILVDRPMAFTFQLLDHDARRMHAFMTMRDAASREVSATHETMHMCIDMTTRRSTGWPPDVMQKLVLLQPAHAEWARPIEAGRIIGIRRNGVKPADPA